MAASSNISPSDLSPDITTDNVVSSNSAGSANSTITSYMLPDLSCLKDFPEGLREKMMEHLVPIFGVAPVNCPASPCYFLKKIPIEIRNQIYEYLLVNPSLSNRSSIKQREKFGAKASYGLTPNIIATCKQINLEASRILYGDNVFFMGVAPYGMADFYRRSPYFSPLTRFNKVSFAVMSKVRRWKIMPLGTISTSQDNITSLTRLCLAISNSELISVDLLLSPIPCYRFRDSYEGLRESLRPFQSLRNVDNFHARCATISEVPNYCRTRQRLGNYVDPEVDIRSFELENGVQELQHLVQGNTPVPDFGKMYNSLLRYVMAFDCCGPSKASLKQRMIEEPRGLGLFASPGQASCRCYSKHFQESYSNGKLLCEAERQIEKQDIVQFKRSRLDLLESLEEQYYRIADASDNMADFIKEAKTCTDEYTRNDTGTYFAAEAWRLLEGYANAFENSEPTNDSTGGIGRHHFPGCGFPPHFRPSDGKMHRYDCFGFFASSDRFKAAVDHLDSQYLKINNAREELYKWDSPDDTGFNIENDYSSPLRGEIVDQSGDESELRIKEEVGEMDFGSGRDMA